MADKIFVTGDTHADIDIKKLTIKNWPEQKELDRDDYLIICGDFGLVWYNEEHGYESYWLDWLEDKNFTTLFIDGNHDNHLRLAEYPEKEWHGGRVNVIRPHVLHLMRGEVYEIAGKKIFTMGGAYSHDISDGVYDKNDPEDRAKLEYIREREKEGEVLMYRIVNESYWKEEVPNENERVHAVDTLNKNNWDVDFVITHEAPATSKILAGYWEKPDEYSQWLESIRANLNYRMWINGHLHFDHYINGRDFMVYDRIIRIN